MKFARRVGASIETASWQVSDIRRQDVPTHCPDPDRGALKDTISRCGLA
jgi:hypothetical protein